MKERRSDCWRPAPRNKLHTYFWAVSRYKFLWLSCTRVPCGIYTRASSKRKKRTHGSIKSQIKYRTSIVSNSFSTSRRSYVLVPRRTNWLKSLSATKNEPIGSDSIETARRGTMRHPSPAARAIRNNPATTTTAPVARATRSPAGARRSTVMAAVTTAIARRSMTPMTRRIAVRPAQQ